MDSEHIVLLRVSRQAILPILEKGYVDQPPLVHGIFGAFMVLRQPLQFYRG